MALFQKLKDKRNDNDFLEQYDKETARLEKVLAEAKRYGKNEDGLNREAEAAKAALDKHKSLRSARLSEYQKERDSIRNNNGYSGRSADARLKEAARDLVRNDSRISDRQMYGSTFRSSKMAFTAQ